MVDAVVGSGAETPVGDNMRTRLATMIRESRLKDDREVTAHLADVLYPELRRLAGGLMRRERQGHTLQPTALVAEAFLKLVDVSRISWQDRTHFLGIAARVMRQVLVDHARRRHAAKRGGPDECVTFDEQLGHGAGDQTPVVDLHHALEKYATLDPRGAQVAELRIFGGLTSTETAAVIGVSERTARSDWAVARMWLSRELGALTRPVR